MMEATVKRVQITKVSRGIKIIDDTVQKDENGKDAVVCSSPNRCIVVFFGEGHQTLLTEKDLVRRCKNCDGTMISPKRIEAGRTYTVCAPEDEFVIPSEFAALAL